MVNDVLGARAHFSTTQQLFFSSFDMNKQTSYVSKYIHKFLMKYDFCGETHTVISAKMVKFLLQVQPRFTMSRLRRLSLSYISEFLRGQRCHVCASIKKDLFMLNGIGDQMLYNGTDFVITL